VAGEQTGHAVRTDRRAWPMPESGPPPHNEVMRLWEACKPVTEDAALSEQLRKRSLWPEGVASIDLARALPDSCAAWPKWAQCGQQTWRESGHRLLFPLWNAKGEHRSLHARLVQKTEGPGKTAKGLFPSGYSAKGLFLADSFARFLLTSGIPPWWRWEEPPSIIVTEGAPDFLTVASHFGEWECVPAVLGVLSGSWSDDLAKQIPDGCRVVVRVHRDEAGKKYRDTICRSLSGRCRVFAEAGEVAHV